VDSTVDKMIAAVVQNWYLVVAIGWLGWKGLPWALKVHGPPMVKETMVAFFANGGGDRIRAIVKEENVDQSRTNHEATARIVAEAIRAHEAVEAAERNRSFLAFEKEITDRYSMERRPPRRKADR
jgi:hypothetical protein